MKVSILTFHDGINYGAFFQVYALRTFLHTQGYESDVINYKNLGFTFREYKYFLNFLRLSPIVFAKNVIKIFKFKKVHKKLNLTKRYFSRKSLEHAMFDRVVIGSDEVWNCNSSFMGQDPVYFSKGINARKILSFAASFGSVQKAQAVPDELRYFLKRINVISVRDDNSASILQQIGIERVVKVLDPTFLIDLSKEAIIPNEHNFILVYGFFSDEMVRNIKEYARVIGKKLIAVSYMCKWCDTSLETLDPFRLLGYFIACDQVITTMYHGMLFSLQNNKNFCLYKTKYRNNKIGTFLKDLGLEKRHISSIDSLQDVFAETIEYENINNLLSDKIKVSKEFLLKSLQ